MGKNKRKTVDNLHRHFAKRLGERYDIYDLSADYVSQMIKCGCSTPVFKESNTRTHHRLMLQGKDVLVVYDTKRGAIVTALPDTGKH